MLCAFCRFKLFHTNLLFLLTYLYLYVLKFFLKLTRKNVEQLGVRRMALEDHCAGVHFLNFKEISNIILRHIFPSKNEIKKKREKK